MIGDGKEWYRHWRTGQRGYRETRDGVDVIVFDRPDEEITRKFNKHDWVNDKESRPLNRMAIAQVAQAADAVLCRVMGNPLKRSSWLDLTDKQRIAWLNEGPTKSLPRRTLYGYVMWAIEWLAESNEPPPSPEVMKEIIRLATKDENPKISVLKEIRELLKEDNADESE